MTASFTNATTTANAAELIIDSLVESLVIDAVYSATVMRDLVRVADYTGKATDTDV